MGAAARLKQALCLAFGLALSAQALAAEYRVVQGDVVALDAESKAKPTVHAFGTDWPVRALERGRWRSWIGVDIAARPGRHEVQWRLSGKLLRRDVLIVQQRKVRVSRITVPRQMARFDAATLARIRREAQTIRNCWRKALSQPAASFGFVRMPLAHYRVSTPFGARRIVNGQRRAPHAGVDLAAPLGTPVIAPAAGWVALVLDGYLTGKTICIAHGDGLASVFMHLKRVDLAPEERVRAGERIGTVGQSGRATGPHLHWGVIFRGKRVDPLARWNPAR